jgi:hypothetical protein
MRPRALGSQATASPVLWSRSPAPPSLQARATTFAGAVVTYLAAGLKHVSEEEYERRVAICRACEFLVDNHCHRCGSKIAGQVFSKARWKVLHCPLGKW